MQNTDFIFTRRSIRSYTGEQVPDGTYETILKAGMSAPSAKDCRPWQFVLVRDKARLEALSEIREYWFMLKKADAAIIVLADLEGYDGTHPDFFTADCAAATENILLAANCCGVGSVWLGLHPIEDAQARVREILNIPGEIIPYSIISLGVPKALKPPKTDFDMTKVHYDTY